MTSEATQHNSNHPHHLMHYKKGALVLIIRKILTKNMYHDLKFLIFTNANPVKRICSD